MADFHEGQEIVCIHGGPWMVWLTGDFTFDSCPVKGAVYTIKRIEPHPDLGEHVALTLKGFQEHRAFISHAFRPVKKNERKTDIGVFKKHLLTKDVREPETV